MLHAMGAWNRYLDPAYGWVHRMTLVWLVFTSVRFALEPLFLHRRFVEAARRDSARAFAWLQIVTNWLGRGGIRSVIRASHGEVPSEYRGKA